MRQHALRFVFALCSIASAVVYVDCARAALPAEIDKGTVSPSLFATQAGELNRELNARDLSPSAISGIRARVPKNWEIETPGRRYSVSSEPLTEMLWQAERDESVRQDKLNEARAWLADMREQVEGYEAGASADDATARNKLADILKRREFAGVGPTSEQDRLRRWINKQLVRFFDWLFGNLNRHPIAIKAFFWLLLAACVAWLAFMLFRFWARSAKLETMQKVEASAFERPWQDWIRAAREAAARGDFREAVHSTYWAAIVRLQAGGTLAADASRTPREFLRMLSDAEGEGVAATEAQRESLARLTTSLERVWYGRRAAGAGDFQESLGLAEELGCRVS